MSVGAVQRYCLYEPHQHLHLLRRRGLDPARRRRDFHQRRWRDAAAARADLPLRLRHRPLSIHRAGPIPGNALLLELGGQWLPWRHAVNGFARVDASSYLQHLRTRQAHPAPRPAARASRPDEGGRSGPAPGGSPPPTTCAATSGRSRLPHRPQLLRGESGAAAPARPGHPARHLRLPLRRGGLDFGGVFNHVWTRAGCSADRRVCADGSPPTPNDLGAWDVRTLTGVLGVNMLFGPLLLRVHFGHPFDIGGIRTPPAAPDLVGDEHHAAGTSSSEAATRPRLPRRADRLGLWLGERGDELRHEPRPARPGSP